ncbi:MAG: hypothetical protein ABGZ23_25180 [Fuerstiella sp.]
MNTSQEHQAPNRIFVYASLACFSLVAGGWLVVTLTEGGWYNIHWVLGPGGLLLLIYASLRLNDVDISSKREALIALGFELAGDDEQQHISVVIESMFEGRSAVVVLASTAIQQTLRCHVAEVAETVYRSTGDDHSQYVRSTVCLFDQNNVAMPPFRLAPHNNIAKTLLARLLSGRQKATGFNEWYAPRHVDDTQYAEIVTPEFRDWLGKHSILSRMRPWTLVSQNGRLMAYRVGTEYTALQYQQLFTSIQELGELLKSSKRVAQVSCVESGPARLQDDVSLLEWTSPTKQQLQQLQRLIGQTPPRQLEPYWIHLTRPRPLFIILSGLVAALAAMMIPSPMTKLISRTFGIEVPQSVEFAIAIGVASLFLGTGFKWHWWSQSRTRTLLRHGKLAHGFIDRTSETGNYEQDRSQFVIHVNFSFSGKPQTAKCQLSVSDSQVGTLDTFAKVGRQVLVLVDPKCPKTIVLPQWLAVCRE